MLGLSAHFYFHCFEIAQQPRLRPLGGSIPGSGDGLCRGSGVAPEAFENIGVVLQPKRQIPPHTVSEGCILHFSFCWIGSATGHEIAL